VTVKQSASHDAARRTLRASKLETDAEIACRAGDQRYLGSRALGDETNRGLEAAGVFFKTDVLVVVNGDLVLRPEQACGGERRHRTLGTHHETFTASDEPARKAA
jgi:hypothetical protein